MYIRGLRLYLKCRGLALQNCCVCIPRHRHHECIQRVVFVVACAASRRLIAIGIFIEILIFVRQTRRALENFETQAVRQLCFEDARGVYLTFPRRRRPIVRVSSAKSIIVITRSSSGGAGHRRRRAAVRTTQTRSQNAADAAGAAPCTERRAKFFHQQTTRDSIKAMPRQVFLRRGGAVGTTASKSAKRWQVDDDSRIIVTRTWSNKHRHSESTPLERACC